MKHPHHSTGAFKSPDGLGLYYQCWRPESAKASLVFIHGMAEHSGRYQFPADYFARHGFAVYAMDLRGHGESGGRRVYADSLDQFLEDIRSFLRLVSKKEGGKKIFLVGHSFGGQLVLNYVARFHDGLVGVIVSSPNIRLKLKVPWIKLFAAPLLARFLPTLLLSNEIDPTLISRDPEVVEAYKKDKKVLNKITTRLAGILLENHRALMDAAGEIETPALLMHAGDDGICSPEGTGDFFEKMSVSDKTLKVYKGFYHELFNEVERERVFKDMEKWIEKRL